VVWYPPSVLMSPAHLDLQVMGKNTTDPVAHIPYAGVFKKLFELIWMSTFVETAMDERNIGQSDASPHLANGTSKLSSKEILSNLVSGWL
jgi:hypothetical protein